MRLIESDRLETEEHQMDITYPRTTFARLAGIAYAIFTRTEGPAATTVTGRGSDLAPMRRRELAARGMDGNELLLARVGPLGPYYGALRR